MKRSLHLYCLAHAGGDARMFVPWAKALPGGVSLRPIQLPGHGERVHEQPPRILEEMVEAVTARLAAADSPFALFGHSLGAVLAYEAAHRLRAGGCPQPVRLFVSGHRAPHLPMRETPIAGLPEAEFTQRLRELSGTPEALLGHPGFLRLLLPALRADFDVSERYRCAERPPLDCPVVAYGGLGDPDVPPRDLAGWVAHTTGPFRVGTFPGGHFYLRPQEAGGALLADLAAELTAGS